jgi:hypothetical protein
MITGYRADRTRLSHGHQLGQCGRDNARDNAASRAASSTVLAASATWNSTVGRCAEVRAHPEGHPLI